MNREKEKMKQQLDKELQHIQFTKQQEVLKRTHPVDFKERLASLWNKEIEIPILPVCTVITILFLSFGFWGFTNEKEHQPLQRELVEAGGNVYWKDQLEKAVVIYEN